MDTINTCGHWIKLFSLDIGEQEERGTTFNSNYARNAYLREDIWEISDNLLEAFPSNLLPDNRLNVNASNLPTSINGSPKLQEAKRQLVLEFTDIFSRTLSKQPAMITPFTFEVNEAERRHPRNRSQARKYDSTKSAAIKETVQKLLEAGIIKPSRAPYYSYGFVVPKSTEGQWRFVVDFKNLNKISSGEHWPIPNIETLLRRIGDKGAKYFNIMDLTSGYFQAPIHPNVQEFTAFMTDQGIFDWTRLPMGPKGAGSYFQKTMTQEVFNGIIQIFCELYLDDLIVFSNNEDDCIVHLRTCFERCREKRHHSSS